MVYMFNILKKLSREMLVSENETIQNALNKVFLVTSWGYGADHWFLGFLKH